MKTETFQVTPDNNPLQQASLGFLLAAANGAIDAGQLIRDELANRGTDLSGKWVGFAAAEEIAKRREFKDYFTRELIAAARSTALNIVGDWYVVDADGATTSGIPYNTEAEADAEIRKVQRAIADLLEAAL